MIIDYISDLHIDHRLVKVDKYNIRKMIEPMMPKGEILIVAGDTNEDNSDLLMFLRIVKREFNYKRIYFVLGNHELYGSEFSHYKEKILALKEKLTHYEDIYLLDGQVEEYNGIKIGGTMMWYDGSYSKHIKQKFDLNEVWKSFMPDTCIRGLNYYNEIFFEERKKLLKIYKECDILVTHIPPLNEPKYIAKVFQKSIATAFFCFDGSEFIKDTSAKHWVFGHVHTKLETELNNIKFHCNPSGYIREANRVIIKQIII